MVEVFKTNVNDRKQANQLIDHIHKTCAEYEANFDLEDCDKILRVKCTSGAVHASCLIKLLEDFGFRAEVLEDCHPTFGSLLLKHMKSYVQMN